jgi:hypothetical protein
MSTIRDTFAQMPKSFQKDQAVGYSAVYQFELSGDGGGTWHVVVADGTVASTRRRTRIPT